MITFKQFEEQWNAMPSVSGGFIKIPLEHQLDLHIGYFNNGIRGLVILDCPEQYEYLSSSVVEVEKLKTKSGKLALVFKLLNDNFEDVYLRLCWDLVSVTEVDVDPWKKLALRYHQWNKLFEDKTFEKGMSFSKQKGLLGELLYLEELLRTHDVNYALCSWKGPEGCDQDFQFDDSWTEIKAVALATTAVKISSLEQLKQDIDGKLVVYVLEKSKAGMELITLTKQIDVVMELIKDVNLEDRFKLMLTRFGYRERDREKYEENSFRLIEKRSYLVNDDFPKLTKDNVDPSIEKATYNISFAGIEKYKEV